MAYLVAVWGLKYADVSTFIQNVSTFCSLAVLRGSFVKLYNLIHSLTGLTPLVHLLGVMVDHLIGTVAGYSLGLTVGAASFQKVDGGVLTKAVKGVFMVVTT